MRNIDTSIPLSSVSLTFVDVAAAQDGPRMIVWKAKAVNVRGQFKAHYDHPGWYIVWRYLIDPTESLETGKPFIIWRVDVIFLEKSDWKYEKSSAGELGGGRTHTFGVKNAAKKLRSKAVYRRKDVIIRDGKPIPRNGNDNPG